jgi:hypothetical protein
MTVLELRRLWSLSEEEEEKLFLELASAVGTGRKIH